MDTPAGFEIQAMSDEGYENLIVEVLYKGEFCFLVSQEDGLENLRVAIYPRKNGEPWDFGVNELDAVLKKAAFRLWELRRMPE
ncbi:MAG TPA: hypothetical protein ENJ09_13930 [Planctomycetes bacterium]|nr:hypothetical protein [Planctomycetota bacterium]